MSHDARPDVSPPTAAPVSPARAVISDASIKAIASRSRERENDHCRRAGAAEEPRYDAGGGRNILLTAELVADHAATDRAASVEAVKYLAVAHVDDKEVVIQVAGEQHAARCHGDAGHERSWPLVAPMHLAGDSVDRLQPALGLIARVRINRAAVVVSVQCEFGWLVGLLESAAPVDRGDEQGVGP